MQQKGKTQKYWAEEKTHTEHHIFYDSTYMKHLNKQIYRDKGGKFLPLVGAGRNREVIANEHEVSFWQNKIF